MAIDKNLGKTWGQTGRSPFFVPICRKPGECPVCPQVFRKLKSGEFRLYSRKKDAKTGKRKNLGTFSSLAAAKKHERAVQFFKRH